MFAYLPQLGPSRRRPEARRPAGLDWRCAVAASATRWSLDVTQAIDSVKTRRALIGGASRAPPLAVIVLSCDRVRPPARPGRRPPSVVPSACPSGDAIIVHRYRRTLGASWRCGARTLRSPRTSWRRVVAGVAPVEVLARGDTPRRRAEQGLSRQQADPLRSSSSRAAERFERCSPSSGNGRRFSPDRPKWPGPGAGCPGLALVGAWPPPPGSRIRAPRGFARVSMGHRYVCGRRRRTEPAD